MNQLKTFLGKLRDTRWHPAVALVVILFFPLIVENSYSEFVRDSELNSRLGWFLLLLAVVWVSRKPFVLAILGTIFMISGSLDLLYASTFGGVFTSASFEAMALTDTAEAIDFLKTYTRFGNMSLLFIYLITSIYFIYNQRILKPDDRLYKTAITLGSLMLMVFIYRFGIMGKVYSTFPGFMGSVKGYVKGAKTIARLVDDRKKLVADSNLALKLEQDDKAQTYIFIIGESLSRNHMSLYGYYRRTTPGLDSYRNELTIFDNVVSSHTQTQPSLRLALTQANTNNKIDVYDALSIVDLANLAGFKTWWISNQHPLRSTVSSIANLADNVHFISNDYHGVMNSRYDGYMLPYIKEAIADKSSKKAIFIHLMGSHLQYDNRYPSDYAVFKDNKISAFTNNPSPRQINYINSYDNSVHYTDWLVSEIITSLKHSKVGSLSGLIFFSDHGEEVFDSMDFVGHRPDSISHSMVEIPFIIWTSSSYKKERAALMASMNKNLSRPYMLDNAYITMANFMGIKSKQLKTQLSLFSTDLKDPVRVVYNKDYDKNFRTSNTTVASHKADIGSLIKTKKEVKLPK